MIAKASLILYPSLYLCFYKVIYSSSHQDMESLSSALESGLALNIRMQQEWQFASSEPRPHEAFCASALFLSDPCHCHHRNKPGLARWVRRGYIGVLIILPVPATVITGQPQTDQPPPPNQRFMNEPSWDQKTAQLAHKTINAYYFKWLGLGWFVIYQ